MSIFKHYIAAGALIALCAVHVSAVYASPSVTVCKVIVDSSGAIVDGSQLSGVSLTVQGLDPNPVTAIGAPAGVLPSTTFTTPLTLNTQLFSTSSGNDAQCATHDNLILDNGGYYYGEETISDGTGWGAVKYTDQYSTQAQSLSDFFSYDNKLFSGGPAIDPTRNENADGHLNLNAARPDRTIVVLNTLLAVVPPPPPTTTQCSDGIDNDGDQLVDMNDPGCDNAADNDETDTIVIPPPPAPVPPPAPQTTGSSGGGANGSPFLISFVPTPSGSVGTVLGANTTASTTAPEGIVLGESTQCGEYLHEYIHIGHKNNPQEVKKLQIFLNEYMNAGLPVTGLYGSQTLAAVNAFQVKHFDNVLTPWVAHGLPTEKTPTGYVYKTTKRWINMIKCPDLQISMPELP